MAVCPTISSETAISIVKGRLFLDYDLRDREFKVETDGDAWQITVHRIKKGDFTGGDPMVWVNKADGSIKLVRHAK